LREIPIVEDDEEEEGGPVEEDQKEKIGVTVRRKVKAGGLGRLKDYSKRKKEMPNPYAPAQVCLMSF
jgi:hypothetical protein